MRKLSEFSLYGYIEFANSGFFLIERDLEKNHNQILLKI